MSSTPIPGQLSDGERALLTESILGAPTKPAVVIEVGTWLGGGSTLHILRALQKNATGHLWGIEFDRGIFERMIASLRQGAPHAMDRFTPLFGRSDEVIPKWLAEAPDRRVDFAFLDGGDHPEEQVVEFDLLDPVMPVGAQLMSHDARVRKGKWFVPYILALDHWRGEVLDLSEVGLLSARKIAAHPSPASRAAAASVLRRVRRQPAELVARFLPPGLRSVIARLMPAGLMRAFMRGGVKKQAK
jgi:Methyltransferase domain